MSVITTMTNPDQLFQPPSDDSSHEEMIAAAICCVDSFTHCFNACDLEGMDAHLHFPHIILSAEEAIIWAGPGNLPQTFFDDLRRDTGWKETRYQQQNAVLVSPRKVHLVLDYTRNRADGSVISNHSNMWIVTFDGGHWGIKQRSY